MKTRKWKNKMLKDMTRQELYKAFEELADLYVEAKRENILLGK